MANKYLETVYSQSRTPKTGYPDKLVAHLISRFDLAKGQTILEVGCGRGDFLLAFKRAGFTCLGVDREVATELAKDVEVKKADVSEALPYADRSVDVVFHKSVIEHMYSSEKLMQETLRVLKPGGKVIILTPDWVSQMKVFYEDTTHCRPYDTTALADAFAMAGFKEVRTEKFYQLPILWATPVLKVFAWPFKVLMPVSVGRALTKATGMKWFRWTSELMVLGYGEKS